MAKGLCPGCGKPAIERLLERVPTIMMDYSGRIWHKVCAEQALAQFQELKAQIKEVFAAEDRYAEHQEHCDLCGNGSMPLCPIGSELHEKWVDLRQKALMALGDDLDA